MFLLLNFSLTILSNTVSFNSCISRIQNYAMHPTCCSCIFLTKKDKNIIAGRIKVKLICYYRIKISLTQLMNITIKMPKNLVWAFQQGIFNMIKNKPTIFATKNYWI